jgi:hypothetical protein
MIILTIEPSVTEVASHRRALEQRQADFMLRSEAEHAESNRSTYSGSISATAPFCHTVTKDFKRAIHIVMGRMNIHTKTRDLNSFHLSARLLALTFHSSGTILL